MSELNGRMPKNPTIIVIFGATGDLMTRKLGPALFNLYRKELLPKFFHIVGFSRQKMSSEEYGAFLADMLEKRFPSHRDQIKSFVSAVRYEQGFFEEREGYRNLAKTLGLQDEGWRTCANKLFYLAVPPQYYRAIFKNLAASGLTVPCGPNEGWTRVVVEKPFGNDLKTAEELDALLGKLFKEEQIYRIDHYLGKETVQNILAFRFSNSFLEPAWNKDSIERIDIRVLETDGVGSRGAFYDGLGALRDVGQNHLLQLLALFAMENPGDFTAAGIRRERAAVLSTLHIMSADDVKQKTVRGQYEGYRTGKDVRLDSATETYFKIKASLNAPRWKDVPVYLESGKRLGETKAEVTVTFKHDAPCLCPPDGKGHYQNALRYRIQPEEKISASFWVKKPGTQMALEEKDFSFDYRNAYAGEELVDAYERLLMDAVAGNQTLFVSTDEITASWRFIDPLIRAWEHGVPPLQTYAAAPPTLAENKAQKTPTLKKEIGFVGLGKMGNGMARLLTAKDWRVAGFDANQEALKRLNGTGIQPASTLKGLCEFLSAPRTIWVMLPAGDAVEKTLFGTGGLSRILTKGDTIIDGGNSFYADSVRRAKRLAKHGIRFLDTGVSGGPHGTKNGNLAFMVGGPKAGYEELEPLFAALAKEGSHAYIGETGAGHFVKMVHNGIEYGMMQAIAEGFALMKKAPFRLGLQEIARVYARGSVIESRLISWLTRAFELYGENLEGISGVVGHTGEGEWTVKVAKKLGSPALVIRDALKFRMQSKRNPSYLGKILSALRNQFGGHDIQQRT